MAARKNWACSHCGNKGHNVRTCPDSDDTSDRQDEVRQVFDEVLGYAKAYDKPGAVRAKCELERLLKVERSWLGRGREFRTNFTTERGDSDA